MEPRIYVACLAAYNNGKLHGRWVDATIGEDAINEEIAAMLKDSPEVGAEEWSIHDHEGFPEGLKIGENESIATIAEMAEALAEHGDAFVAAYRNFGDVEQAIRAVKESYQGAWKSLGDWADSFLEETGSLKECPESLRPYIDVERWARDAELGGDIWTAEVGGEIHVFWNR